MSKNATLITIDSPFTAIEALSPAGMHEASLPLTNSRCCLFCGEANATHSEYCTFCWERYAEEYLTWYEGQAHLIRHASDQSAVPDHPG